jgi:uncharacterized protein (TIGR02058 family)
MREALLASTLFLGLLAGAWGASRAHARPALARRALGSSTRSGGGRRMGDGHEPSRESTCATGMSQVLFIETGFGCDQHGQNPTKAAIRACRNAIEFNSIPSIAQIVPGGYAGMKLRVQLGVPDEYRGALDLSKVAEVFPYGTLLPVELVTGGMKASSGIALEAMGDKDDSMIIVIAVVTVGY